jgi:hypothetical protein
LFLEHLLRVLKVALVILAIPLALFVGWIAWMFFTFEVLYPLQYERLQTEAEEWNKENWEAGSALRVTVQVSSGEALGRPTATVDCYQKQFARPGGLKGRPAAPKVIQRHGPAYLIVPFGPNAALYTPLRDVCSDALRKHKDWQLPHVTESHYYWATVVADDKSFSCFLGNDPRTSQAQVTRPAFVDVEEVPLRTLLSINDYQALPYRVDDPYHGLPQTYYWWTEEVETKCWRIKRSDACTPKVEQVCGTPYR